MTTRAVPSGGTRTRRLTDGCHNPSSSGASTPATFEHWTQGREIVSLGTNTGSPELPFQGWRRFKEAFAPELVARAVEHSAIAVKRCLDPFGGSGTTALACQFLGVQPITVEVNPFLADLIEAKLASYDPDVLARDFDAVMKNAAVSRVDVDAELRHLPATFVEPGAKGRWIFDRGIAVRIGTLLASIDELDAASHRRLFRVLLGGILIDVSNVVTSGKGRRYRGGWEQRTRDPIQVDEAFRDAAERAILDIRRHSRRACKQYEVHIGDCREFLHERAPYDLAVFSPPYPNSFDYTDVYNVELWMLGYLTDSQSNHALRTATLCSHVQIGRNFAEPPSGSSKLNTTLKNLVARRTDLWDRRIPDMVGSYFNDIMTVLEGIHRSLTSRGCVWMVVGDSSYADVQVNVADIITELLPQSEWQIKTFEPCRSMRVSPQQGGRTELAETLLVLGKV